MVPKKQTDSIPIPNTKPDSDKRIIDLKKGDPLPDISFEELISIVKTERQQEFKNKIPEPSRMVFTFHDIEQRQKMIDGLMQELDARANAIRKIGSDLYSLREINSRLEETVKSLEKKVSDNDIKTAQLINTVDIEVLSLPELQRRYALLVQKLSIELKRSNEMGEMLQSAQVSKIERNEAEKKYLELVHAHKEQSAYIQKLQDSLKQNTRYKAAIKKQELVIQKLEVLLKDSMQGANKGFLFLI